MKERKIIWCPQHTPTQSQLDELKELGYTEILNLKELSPITFEDVSNCPSDEDELYELAFDFIDTIIPETHIVLPIGSPAFMAMLIKEMATRHTSYTTLFAHSERVSVDKVQEDGTTIKTSVFNHVKFIKLEV